MTVKWTGLASAGNILTTEMNSLADNGITAAGTAYDNSTNKVTTGALELNLASLTPTGTPYVIVYMIKALDGTTYQDAPAAGGANSNAIRISIPVTTGAGAKNESSQLFLIPSCPVKFLLENQTNVALASSGNTLELFVDTLVDV